MHLAGEGDGREGSRLIDQIGEARLRAVIADFYQRVFGDIMIGYLFARTDRARLVELETQLVARLLGAKVVYEGRSMREAHRSVRILDGHFARRMQILRETLADHQVPEPVARAWLSHAEALRSQVITGEESCSAPPPERAQ